MFKLSASGEYALLVVLHLRKNPGYQTIDSIAMELRIPVLCVRQISPNLERAGIIVSRKGRSGGVAIVDRKFSVGEVLEASGEDLNIALCGGEHGCDKSANCELSPVLGRLHKGFSSILSFTQI